MRETLTIETLSGEKLALSGINGARLISVNDKGPQPKTTYSQNPGLDGNQDNGTTFDSRSIEATFLLSALEQNDYTLATYEIWRYLFKRESFYLSWSRMPGYRYLVHTKPFEYSKINFRASQFTVEFEAFTGFRESVGTTLDPFSYDGGLWQIGQELPSDEDLRYIFHSNRFNIYNASDITIDPVQHHLLQIALTCSGTPSILNHTTGDTFSMTQAIRKSDVLLIDGIYPYLNNQHCGRDTNHGLITLAKGDNDIEITGASNILISWLFRYLYM